MTSSVSQISRKAISKNQWRFWSTYSSAKIGSLVTVWTAQRNCPDAHQCSKKCLNTSADTNHRELMFTQMSEQPSEQQLQRASVCPSVWIANWKLRIVKTVCNRLDVRATPSGLDDWRLMKKRVKPRKKKSVTACRPEAHCLGIDTAKRTLNQTCIRSSKAYI